MSQRDYYEVLEVSRSADDAEIKKSYRRLAMKYHPDRNPGDKVAEEQFKEIQKAYEVLSDPQKKTAYDQFGHAGVNQGAGGGFSGGFNFGDIFEDMFSDMFGGSRNRKRGAGEPGSDLRYDLSLTLEEAVKGTTVKINVPTYASCQDCSGSGAKKGTKPTTCQQCNGSGHVQLQQGFFVVQQACPVCRGSGQMIKDPCTSCRGQGRKRTEKTLSVKVPAGVDNGDRIRLAGEGEAGTHGGQTGDLYVQINVKEHALFKRDGSNLHCEVPISYALAALGGELDIPTLEGKVKLTIPAETQTGKMFRLRGKGIKSVRDHSPGDMICHIMVETPVNLTKKQKELLQELELSLKDDKINHSPRTSSWFDGVKKFFN